MVDYSSLVHKTQGCLLGRKSNKAKGTIAVHKDHKAPLREEVPKFFLAVTLGNATNEDLALIAITKTVKLPRIVSIPRCRKVHV